MCEWSATLSMRARELRANSTDAERLLWLRLRNRSLVGAKFRRQVSFPPYTVDFCCFEAKLIVEVDGSQHAERAAQDAVRTKRLEGDGLFGHPVLEQRRTDEHRWRSRSDHDRAQSPRRAVLGFAAPSRAREGRASPADYGCEKQRPLSPRGRGTG
jgi:very-short-patch-repair endonuclease